MSLRRGRTEGRRKKEEGRRKSGRAAEGKRKPSSGTLYPGVQTGSPLVIRPVTGEGV